MRTALTALGHDHRRRGRDRHGGDRQRRAGVDRERNPQRRHERRHRHRRLERLRSREAGQRRDDDADAGRRRRRFAREVPGIRYLSPGRNTRRRSSPNPPTGTRRSRARARICRRFARGRFSTASFFSERRTCSRAAKVAVLGSVVARSAVRRRHRSDGRDDSDQEPAVPGDRRADQQGPGGDGTGSGRHRHRAVHDRAEEAARHDAPAEHHALDGRRRAVRRGLRRDHDAAARTASARARRADDFTVRTLEEMASVLTSTTDDDDVAAGQHRGGVAARRRHRHHEHHAGVGDRTDAGDRAAAVGRRARRRRAPAVPGRGARAQPGRRRARRRRSASPRPTPSAA